MASRSQSTLLALAVAALLVTSGCNGLTLGSPGQSGPPTDDVVERYNSIETVEATQVSTLTRENNTTTSRTLVRIDRSGEHRQYSRQLAPPEHAGDRTVVNESVALIYDASENEATRIPRSETLSAQNRSVYLARIVDAARRDDGVVEPGEDVSPLPVVPATTTAASVPTGSIEGYSVEYLGTRTVADRTAHGFRMTAVSDAAMDLNQTLWLDSEYYYPLATNQTLTVGNTTMHVESRLENVSFNAGLPDDAFDADLPANATVNTTEFVDTETYETRAALAANASMSVPDPDLPDGYAFEGGQVISGNFSQVTLRYVDDGGLVTVSKTANVSNATGTPSTGENVTVAGHDGRYVTTGSAILVSWSCDGHTYSVTATALDREQLLDVAASVDCQ